MSDKIFYTFEPNHRVYQYGKDGYARGGPVYSEHFRPIKVLSETDKAYITDRGTINKRSMKLAPSSHSKDRYAVFTEAEREADLWMRDNRYKLMRAVDRCRDIDTLKQIASLVGYTESTIAPELANHSTENQD